MTVIVRYDKLRITDYIHWVSEIVMGPHSYLRTLKLTSGIEKVIDLRECDIIAIKRDKEE